MTLPETRVSRLVEPIITTIGNAISWLWLLLLLIIVANVTLRYLFGEGRVEFEEIQWHIYAAGFLLGLSYAYGSDSHIRVDVMRGRLSPRAIAWIELYGIIILLMPFSLLIIIFGIPFVASSFQLQEISQAPGGLPYRWLIKAVMPLAFLLLLASVISRLTQVWSYLFFTPENHGCK